MTTASDIIQDALEQLGIYGPGETMTAADSARGIAVLNIMINNWTAENIFVYSTTPLTATITSSAATYTVGQNGSPSVLANRPNRVDYGPGVASVTVSGTIYPVNIVSAVEFQALQGYAPPSGIPDTLWYNPTYPNGTLNVLPTPNSTGSLSFSAWYALTSFSTLTQDYTFSQGALEALRDSLSVALKPYYETANLDPVIAARAAEAKDFLRYQAQTSRAMFKRFTLATNPAQSIR